MNKDITNIFGLDVGEKRIGVACATWPNGIPYPLKTINNDEAIFTLLNQLITDMNVAILVIGMPRNLSMSDTRQTNYVKDFIATLKKHVGIKLFTIDEALTSVKAEEELSSRKGKYTKSDIDALSATYILEDFIIEHKELSLV